MLTLSSSEIDPGTDMRVQNRKLRLSPSDLLQHRVASCPDVLCFVLPEPGSWS